jgi:glutamate 5-kinase
MRYGEKMIIANSRVPQVLQKIISGEKIGTIFIGKNKHLNSRKKWVSIRRSTGTVVVDEGAEIALISKKKSLLASGITRINGTFDMGSVVSVHSCNGTKIAKGIVNYNSGELNQIKGLKSSEIKKVLGSKFFDEVINRDDLIIY